MPDTYDLLAKERAALSEAISWPGLKRRQFKYQYAAIEVALIEKFNASLSASVSPSTVEVDGFVSRVGGTMFVLRPSLAVNFGVLCEMDDSRRLPTDFQFGHVRGRRIMRRTKAEGLFASRWRLSVEDFTLSRLPSDHLKPEISPSAAGDMILQGYPDPPGQLKRDLVFSLTSSPGEMRRRGGLTATLFPVHERFAEASYSLLRDLERSIPKDLTSDNSVQVSIPSVGSFEIAPFPWNIRSMWSSELEDRSGFRAPSEPGFGETTTGISANSVAPKSLDEIWMRMTDFPLLIEGSLVRYARPAGIDLDLAKFLITVHSSRPYAEPSVEDGLLALTRSKLTRLRRDYDGLGYSGIVDLDVRGGSPRSIMAIAKSIARAKGTERVSAELIENASDEFVNSREEIFEIWSDLGLDFGDTQLSTQKKLAKIGKTAERIYVFVREHPGSTRAEIRENFSKVQESVFAKSFDEMLRQSILYLTSSVEDRYSAI